MSNFYQKLCDAISAASVREQEPMRARFFWSPICGMSPMSWMPRRAII